MRKLAKGESPKKQISLVPYFIKGAGFVLFVLGMITLFALVSWYEYTAGVPGWSVAVAVLELAAGGLAIKCARLPRYAKHVMIAAIALTAGIFLSIAFTGSAQWPFIVGCVAACVLLVGSIVNFTRHKKRDTNHIST